MALDTSLIPTAGVDPSTMGTGLGTGLGALSTPGVDPAGTGLYLSSGTTGSTSSSSLALQSASSTKVGLMSDPTLYSYGTGIAASAGIIGGALLTGAVIAGVGLLSYAITKAALEP
jgi:hypothetical protein